MNKNNHMYKTKIILFITALIILFVIGFYLIKPYLPHDYGTTTGNFMNGQRVAELDGEFYFFFGGDDKEEGLYKIDTKGKVTKISDQNGVCLNAVGDYLYFVNWYETMKDSYIMKMKKDGSESQILFKGDIGGDFIVVDQKIYFGYMPDNEDYTRLYCITTDGKGLKKSDLRGDIFLQLLLNPKMSSKDMVFSYDTEYDGYSMQMRDKYMYLYKISEDSDSKYYDLYCTKRNGTKGKFLADRVTAFNVAGDGYLYYAQLNENLGSVTISKMNMDTEEHEQLVEIVSDGGQIFRINVAVDKINIVIEGKGAYLLNTDGTGLIKISDLLNHIEK